MKAKLEFDLPEEHTEFELAAHALDWYMITADLMEWIHSTLQYETEGLDAATLEEVKKQIRNLLSESNLTLD